METQDLNLVEDLTVEKPKIYRKNVIIGFSIFFSTIFGCVLMMQNLKSIGKKKEANFLLLLSIIYTIITLIIVNIPEEPNTSLTYLLNLIGALIFTHFFYKKDFADEKSFGKKKIWKPLIISILITIPFILIIIYG